MSIQVTVTLSDEAYKRAEQYATFTGKSIDEILAWKLENIFPEPILDTAFITRLSNERLITLLDAPMEGDERLSDLLDRQQAGLITPEEIEELEGLMQLYNQLVLSKAYMLKEAVERGLRKRLDE
jgi:hypothetical protein